MNTEDTDEADNTAIGMERINISLPYSIKIRERVNPLDLRYVGLNEKFETENSFRERLLLFFP